MRKRGWCSDEVGKGGGQDNVSRKINVSFCNSREIKLALIFYIL